MISFCGEDGFLPLGMILLLCTEYIKNSENFIDNCAELRYSRSKLNERSSELSDSSRHVNKQEEEIPMGR